MFQGKGWTVKRALRRKIADYAKRTLRTYVMKLKRRPAYVLRIIVIWLNEQCTFEMSVTWNETHNHSCTSKGFFPQEPQIVLNPLVTMPDIKVAPQTVFDLGLGTEGKTRAREPSSKDVDPFHHRLHLSGLQVLQICVMSVTIAPIRFICFFMGEKTISWSSN